MTVAGGVNARFEIGRVASRTFEVVGKNFATFFVLGLIATLPTTFFTAATTLNAVSGVAPSGVALAETFGSAFVGFILSLILQAAVTYGAVSYLSNQPIQLGRALAIGLSQFLPLFAIGFLESIGLLIGFVLLIVPGFIFLTMWSAVVPVRVSERTGIFQSFSRSQELTSGFRWPIFGTLVIYFIGAGIAQFAVRPLIALGGAGSGLSAMAIVGIGLNAIVAAIIAVTSATLFACIYYELREIKEGVGPQQIAAVFD
jgi:hypothetical protein